MNVSVRLFVTNFTFLIKCQDLFLLAHSLKKYRNKTNLKFPEKTEELKKSKNKIEGEAYKWHFSKKVKIPMYERRAYI